MPPKTEDGLRPTRQPPTTETQPFLKGRAVKGKIFDVLWSMKKNGYSDYTITLYRKALSLLDKHCDLDKPESVKRFLVQNETTDGYKRNLVYSYERYSKYHVLARNRPKYRFINKLPKIPTKSKVDMIISTSNKKLALQLKISKETGLRPIEVVSLRVRDIDFDNGTIIPQRLNMEAPEYYRARAL